MSHSLTHSKCLKRDWCQKCGLIILQNSATKRTPNCTPEDIKRYNTYKGVTVSVK
jgi:hypothetical protein